MNADQLVSVTGPGSSGKSTILVSYVPLLSINFRYKPLTTSQTSAETNEGEKMNPLETEQREIAYRFNIYAGHPPFRVHTERIRIVSTADLCQCERWHPRCLRGHGRISDRDLRSFSTSAFLASPARTLADLELVLSEYTLYDRRCR